MKLVALDVETTGVDVVNDRIVEIALVTADVDPDSFEAEVEDRWVTRVDPRQPIPPSATRVHGFTDEDVADAPTFQSIAEDVEARLAGRIIVGYASRRFDVLVVDAELRRAGRDGLDLFALEEIDPLAVEVALYPRDLDTLAAKYGVEVDEEGRHGAAYDAEAALAVAVAQAKEHGLSLEDEIRASKPEEEIDRARRFVKDEEGVVRFNFGKHRGKEALSQPGYLRWMLTDGEWASDTYRATRELLRRARAAG